MRRPIRRLRRNGRPPARARLIRGPVPRQWVGDDPDGDDDYDYDEEEGGIGSVDVEGRHTRFVSTGVLDANGQLLIRAIVPVKCKMGFQTPGRDAEVADEVVLIMTEAEVQANGHELHYIDYREVEDD